MIRESPAFKVILIFLKLNNHCLRLIYKLQKQASGLTFALGTLILECRLGLESLGFNKPEVLFSYLTEIFHEPPFTADPNDTCIGC